jgi:hypothetical protein
VSWEGAVWDEPLRGPATSDGRRRIPGWTWALIGLFLTVPLLLLSPLVAPLALVVLVTGIVGLSRGSRTWLRLGSRRAAIGVTAGAAVLLLATGSVSAAMLPREAATTIAAERPQLTDSQDRAAEADTGATVASPTPSPTPVVTSREETVIEAIAFEQTTVEDPGLPRGQTAISVNGQEGQRAFTYIVTLVDGVEKGRELVSEVVTVAPVTQVTAVGIYDAPPPPPPPAASGCDSNYVDACVPVSSDVDCAWGSGNGPAYFDGVARVVGSDIYDLDRDGDGWACEQ